MRRAWGWWSRGRRGALLGSCASFPLDGALASDVCDGRSKASFHLTGTLIGGEALHEEFDLHLLVIACLELRIKLFDKLDDPRSLSKQFGALLMMRVAELSKLILLVTQCTHPSIDQPEDFLDVAVDFQANWGIHRQLSPNGDAHCGDVRSPQLVILLMDSKSLNQRQLWLFLMINLLWCFA